MDYKFTFEDGSEVLVHGGPGSGRKLGSKNKKGTKAERGEAIVNRAYGVNEARPASAVGANSKKRYGAAAAKAAAKLKKKKSKLKKIKSGKSALTAKAAKKYSSANSSYDRIEAAQKRLAGIRRN